MKENNEEEERIAKWRAERAAVAEQQKQERLAKKENEVTEDEAERVAKWRVERAAVAEKKSKRGLIKKISKTKKKKSYLKNKLSKRFQQQQNFQIGGINFYGNAVDGKISQ